MKQLSWRPRGLSATRDDAAGSVSRRDGAGGAVAALCALIEPFYPKPGNGRPPIGVERMLRIYFLQHWFNLSDPAVEEALYDLQAMRHFVGIDLGHEPVPDETTVCRSVTCSKSMIWGRSCSKRCSGTWQRKG